MQVQATKPNASVKFLEGFVILFSGVEESRRNKAKEVAIRYGGKCVEKFSSSVTCGVVERVGASGYKELVANKIYVVTMKWLLDCVNSRSLAPLEATQYRVLPFTGLVIVCTQVSMDERDRVQKLVQSNGGVFSERFMGDQCTHLVAKTPTGDKYSAAKKCGNVKIVTNDWIEECAKQKVWVQETAFSVDLLARRALKLQAESDAQKANKTASDKSVTFQMEPHITAQTTRSLSVHLVVDIEHVLVQEVPISDLPSVRTASSSEASKIFNGMVFWVKGYTQEVTDYITSCILAGGGLRSMVLCDDVTVAVLGEQCAPKQNFIFRNAYSDFAAARRHPCGLEFVNLTFLLENLFSYATLRELIQDKEPFLGLFQRAKSSNIELTSVEEMAVFYDQHRLTRWEGKEGQNGQNGVLLEENSISTSEVDLFPKKARFE